MPRKSEYDKAVDEATDLIYQSILVSSNDKVRAMSVAKDHAESMVNSIIEATMERIARNEGRE